jgi:hypothetical protein
MTFIQIQMYMELTSTPNVRALNFKSCPEMLYKVFYLGCKGNPNFQALFKEVQTGKGGATKGDLQELIPDYLRLHGTTTLFNNDSIDAKEQALQHQVGELEKRKADSCAKQLRVQSFSASSPSPPAYFICYIMTPIASVNNIVSSAI